MKKLLVILCVIGLAVPAMSFSEDFEGGFTIADLAAAPWSYTYTASIGTTQRPTVTGNTTQVAKMVDYGTIILDTAAANGGAGLSSGNLTFDYADGTDEVQWGVPGGYSRFAQFNMKTDDPQNLQAYAFKLTKYSSTGGGEFDMVFVKNSTYDYIAGTMAVDVAGSGIWHTYSIDFDIDGNGGFGSTSVSVDGVAIPSMQNIATGNSYYDSSIFAWADRDQTGAKTTDMHFHAYTGGTYASTILGDLDNVSLTPEPATALLLLSGLAFIRRKK